ncbi:MAG: M23 family metallopeptidase [Chloroflexota bacterium]|nr:M23 family metallopeptidase [Chloroflexota bacterium]
MRVVTSLLASCLLAISLGIATPAVAQDSGLRLPMADAPGAATWLLGQPYGNTIGAFLRGDEWYRAGQRLHFGMDFSMPCGSPLVAVGDGTVMFTDDMGFGSAPHNLILRLDAGYVALYGHLLQPPTLAPGDRVAAGDPVGLSGDPDETCDSRPHLHFEMRSLDYQTTYNPAALIPVNWHALTAIGSFGYPQFQQDLDNARQWMSIDDQPDVRFWGQPLNLYAAPYPDYRGGSPPANPPLARAPLPMPTTATLARLAFGGCCAGAWWDARDPGLVYTIDGSPGQRAAIFAWQVGTGDFTLLDEAPPPYLSADGTMRVVRRWEGQFGLIDTNGTETLIQTGGAFPSLSRDNALAMWTSSAPNTSLDAESDVTVWVAESDAANGRWVNARAVALTTDGGASWIDDRRLLVTGRDGLVTRLSVVDVISGETFVLGDPNGYFRIRGISIAPGGGRLLFYLMNQPDPAASGMYTIETTPGTIAVRLPWFGAWRWRDAETVYYLPFDDAAGSHTLRVTDLTTGEDRALTDPTVTPFTVANGDWGVSADGTRLTFTDARDRTTWVITVE